MMARPGCSGWDERTCAMRHDTSKCPTCLETGVDAALTRYRSALKARRTDCDECGAYTTAIHGYGGWLCRACLDDSLYGPWPVECPQCGGAQRIVGGEGEGEVRCPGCAGWGFVDHLKGA